MSEYIHKVYVETQGGVGTTYDVKDSAAGSAITQLANDGTIAITKELSWINAYVNSSGVVTQSSLSQTCVVPMNAGEIVTVGTINTNITIIGSTSESSVDVGDTVTPIQKTSSTAQYEEYSYTATEPINIVICVLQSDYNLSFGKLANPPQITELQTAVTDNGNKIEYVIDLLEDDYAYNSVTLTMTTNKLINSAGNVGDIGSADWSVSDLVDVSGNTFVRVCGSSGWTNLVWALYDADQNFISGYATGGATEAFDNLVPLGENVKYIRIAQIASVLKGSLYTITGLDTEQIKNTLSDLVTPDEVNNITISLIDGKYIASDHSIPNISATQYKVSNNIPVLPNEALVISATVGYQTNMFYAFYNASGVYVSGEGSTEAGSKTFNVTVPPEASYLVVSAYQGNATVGKATSFKIKGKWTGKKWVCLGDSLTEVNSRTTKHYHDYIAEKTGITITNMGNSGSGYMKNQDISKAFYQIAQNIPLDADVYTIFGSGNDLSLTLGTPTDTGTTTVCGCINETIDVLIELLPTIQLGIVAPTPWSTYPPSTANNAMALYVDALKTICENRSIPFLDLYHCSNLRPWTAEGRETCYSKDDGGGAHPDETGHKIIAPRFEGFLDSLLLT